MEISALDAPFSFRVKTSSGEVWVNKEGAPLFSVLLTECDKENVLGWQGEYDRASIAVKILDFGALYFLATMMVEGVRIAFFSTEGAVFSEELTKEIGNVDVLFFEKKGESISDSQAKKLLEEVDPRIVIVPVATTGEFMKKSGFPLEILEKLSLSKAALPEEKTLFYAL